MKHLKKTLVGLIAIIAALSVLYYFIPLGQNLILTKSTFNHLLNWEQDDHSQALLAFQKSCAEILKRDPKSSFSSLSQSGQVRDWQVICLAASKCGHPDKKSAQQFFETWFVPYSIQNNLNSRGLFTGYYLPLIHGSLKQDKQYSIPVYGLPNDLIKIDLGLFRTDLSGKSIVGQLKNNRLLPYPDRTAITNGAIKNSAKVLVWCDNLIDVFFAQIQGSAVVQLPNQQQILIGYAGANGRPYTSIGKVLIENKFLSKETISMQTIRTWLLQYPDQANNILNHNASYVFFQILKGSDPIGTEQVPLTPGRSLAVDTHYIPLGAPIWLDTIIPQKKPGNDVTSYQHLLIAQDTGGDIKGIIRGDIYWGAGDEAAFVAGHMKNSGQSWILLPRLTRSGQK